jgi:hypothetical protein
MLSDEGVALFLDLRWGGGLLGEELLVLHFGADAISRDEMSSYGNSPAMTGRSGRLTRTMFWRGLIP